MAVSSSIKLAVSSAVLLCACATPTVVQTVKPGDTGLNCAQLQNEYVDTERFRIEADKEKGMTGGNVARALLFWPAILGSYSNANEAMAAADARKVHLANQMSQKNCAIPATQAAADSKPADAAPTLAANPQSPEDRLKELKRLHDANLISKEVYLERQKTLLNTL